MLCREIMKGNMECLAPEDTVATAARKMRDANVGFLPVCDKNKAVLGTVTDRDLALRVLADDKPARTTVEEIMTRDIVSVRPEDDIRSAEQLMGRRQKSRILCIEDGRLVGVISLSDIAQHEPSDRAADTLRKVAAREARPDNG